MYIFMKQLKKNLSASKVFRNNLLETKQNMWRYMEHVE